MKKLLTIIFLGIWFIALLPLKLTAQKADSIKENKDPDENIKTGWTFGGVPALAYDSDIGFKYGAVLNFYFFGDGTTYPQYLHSIYLEWSRTTKGSGINQFIYDTEYLIPKTRLTFEASYLTEKALDFYGFNGYEAAYYPEYENDAKSNSDYRSRMYYRYERRLLRIKTDFQGQIIGRKLRWYAGFSHYGIDMASVDIEKINEGKSQDDMLPSIDSVPGLYDRYVDWGVIPQKQATGGFVNLLKTGVVYDTRDNEANPNHGIWTEGLLLTAPKFFGNNDFQYTKFVLTHRQYFTLIKKRLTFAYRLSYQAKISGEMPFYMLPFVYDTKITRDGLGGAKTLRGILRNRVVGESMTFANFEFRWKVVQTIIRRQNVYFALSTFTDMGMVTKKYDFPNPQNRPLKADSEGLHISYGAGLHVALNENFIVAIDYGMAADKRDGEKGLYIGLNFLF